MKRISATVLFADIAGYTRLMAEDEGATTEAVASIRQTIAVPLFHRSNCRLIRMMGDAFFVEFRTPVDAVGCAVSLQRDMAEFNRQRPSARKLQFRVGINCGDVIIDEADPDRNLYGTDVNIAARLEQIADVGGIWISERVRSSVGSDAGYTFRPLGSRRLKNIAGRIPVYEVAWNPDDDGAARAAEVPGSGSANSTIVVLPLEDLTGPEAQPHLGRAIVEDVMTELGRFTELSIISPDSAAVYERSSLSIREIGRRLNADYVVTGTILRRGHDLSVTARLFETEAGEQIWANRYSDSLKYIFDLQDTIARDLAMRLPLRMENLGLQRSRFKPIENLDAYDCYIRGRALYRLKNPESDSEAISLLNRAIEFDPEFADPYAVLGAIYGIQWAYTSWGVDPTDQILKGRRLIRSALRRNNDLPRAYGHLGWTYLSTFQFDRAAECFEKAVSLNPNDTDVLLLKAYALIYMGEPLESIRVASALIDLNPHFPLWYKDVLGGAQFVAGQYEESLETLEEAADMFPESAGWIAACQAKLGMEREARRSAELFMVRARAVWKGPRDAGAPEIINWFLRFACPFKVAGDRENLRDGLMKAGLPVPDEEAVPSRESQSGIAGHP